MRGGITGCLSEGTCHGDPGQDTKQRGTLIFDPRWTWVTRLRCYRGRAPGSLAPARQKWRRVPSSLSEAPRFVKALRGGAVGGQGAESLRQQLVELVRTSAFRARACGLHHAGLVRYRYTLPDPFTSVFIGVVLFR